MGFSLTYSFRPHYDPGTSQTLTEISTTVFCLCEGGVGGGGGIQCVGLTTLLDTCADCLEILEASTSRKFKARPSR
jgi:hypothetical protein